MGAAGVLALTVLLRLGGLLDIVLRGVRFFGALGMVSSFSYAWRSRFPKDSRSNSGSELVGVFAILSV